MDTDQIIQIGQNENDLIFVKPKKSTFPYIYREAMEVKWDEKNLWLCAKPRGEWSQEKWFEQILYAAKEQGVMLEITADTKWLNIPDELRQKITQIYSSI